MPVTPGKENQAAELQSQIDYYKQLRDDHGTSEQFEERQFTLAELDGFITKLENALAAM